MKNTFKICAILAAVLLLACSKSTEPTEISGTSFALIDFTLIDGRGGEPVEDAVLIVDSGMIVAVGARRSVPVPQGTIEVDLNGAFVLPGFFNAHVHNALDRPKLEAWARAGVTTVRDLCGPSSFGLGDQLSADPSCARLVMSGPMLSVPGGYPYVPWGSPCMMEIESPEDARETVTQLVNGGADVIKLAAESGQEFGMDIPTLSAEEALAIVETTHELGTVASAHVLVAYDMARALDAGADDLAHMVVDDLSDRLIERAVSDGVYWVPTLELWYHVGYGRVDAAVANLQRYVAAGGKVATGTDYDGLDAEFQLGMPFRELQLMLNAGMSPMEVIVASTRNAAAVCNLSDSVGTLETGKIADILVINSSPLQSIAALEGVVLVVRNGVVIRDER